jgi:Spy/CpxP family protein refolding chaperone
MKKGLSIAAAVLVLAAGLAAADDPGGGKASAPGLAGAQQPLRQCLRETFDRLRALGAELELTPDQKLDIALILRDNRDDIVEVVRQVHERRRTLMHAVRAEEVDEAGIRRAARNLADAAGDAAVLRARIRRETRRVLTAQQRREVDAAIDEIEQMWDAAVQEFSSR